MGMLECLRAPSTALGMAAAGDLALSSSLGVDFSISSRRNCELFMMCALAASAQCRGSQNSCQALHKSRLWWDHAPLPCECEPGQLQRGAETWGPATLRAPTSLAHQPLPPEVHQDALHCQPEHYLCLYAQLASDLRFVPPCLVGNHLLLRSNTRFTCFLSCPRCFLVTQE